MLRRLTIKNIALIEYESIEFEAGFTVFSGETGAGKSLVIDSLNLVLGARADKSLISYGKDFAEVEAFFDCVSPSAIVLLKEFGIDDDEIVVCRRIFSDGRNDVKVNGHSITVKMLKNLSSCLVDVCGQFENQTMFVAKNQLELIDSVAGNFDSLLKLNECFDKIKDIDKKLTEIGGNDTERERLLDMLSFQIGEIEDANFEEGEEEGLKAKHERIVARDKIIGALSLALGALGVEKDMNAADCIKDAALSLSSLSNVDERMSEIESTLSSVSYDVKDCIAKLSDLADEYSDSDQDINAIEERLDLLNRLKKKYGDSISKINEFLHSAKQKYDLLLGSEENIEKLEKEKQLIGEEAEKLANGLSEKRKQVSEKLSKDIQYELSCLGMKSAKFSVVFDEKGITRDGKDEIEFMFSANSGMPLKPLSKVASGGELSRFMLALKTVLGRHSHIPTMVFDEIDSGISGVVGRIVGEKLYSISRDCQVVCVSHLAQIASIADNNFLIEKIENSTSTNTKVNALFGLEKIKEVARLSGGDLQSEVSLAHAKNLIDAASEYKLKLNNN